jgi:hypothetical protein
MGKKTFIERDFYSHNTTKKWLGNYLAQQLCSLFCVTHSPNKKKVNLSDHMLELS